MYTYGVIKEVNECQSYYARTKFCPIYGEQCKAELCMAWIFNIDEKYGYCKLIERT